MGIKMYFCFENIFECVNLFFSIFLVIFILCLEYVNLFSVWNAYLTNYFI